jgi:hypothetical protein
VGDTPEQHASHGDMDHGLGDIETSLVVTHDLHSADRRHAYGRIPNKESVGGNAEQIEGLTLDVGELWREGLN